ncbi:MAG: hypothetical protein ACU0A6_11405 [Shimia sp.]|uniref:hypothetical protein n=1 Tax=Shimia sp. TaxID=1954381 RepID=UPI0040580915
MKHVPVTALEQPSRFARLFELIRQENLIQDRIDNVAVEDPRDFVADFLKKSASASLRPAA